MPFLALIPSKVTTLLLLSPFIPALSSFTLVADTSTYAPNTIKFKTALLSSVGSTDDTLEPDEAMTHISTDGFIRTVSHLSQHRFLHTSHSFITPISQAILDPFTSFTSASSHPSRLARIVSVQDNAFVRCRLPLVKTCSFDVNASAHNLRQLEIGIYRSFSDDSQSCFSHCSVFADQDTVRLPTPNSLTFHTSLPSLTLAFTTHSPFVIPFLSPSFAVSIDPIIGHIGRRFVSPPSGSYLNQIISILANPRTDIDSPGVVEDESNDDDEGEREDWSSPVRCAVSQRASHLDRVPSVFVFCDFEGFSVLEHVLSLPAQNRISPVLVHNGREDDLSRSPKCHFFIELVPPLVSLYRTCPPLQQTISAKTARLLHIHLDPARVQIYEARVAVPPSAQDSSRRSEERDNHSQTGGQRPHHEEQGQKGELIVSVQPLVYRYPPHLHFIAHPLRNDPSHATIHSSLPPTRSALFHPFVSPLQFFNTQIPPRSYCRFMFLVVHKQCWFSLLQNKSNR
ncbi:hypothetical protein BLNAU_20408 [Blattamonas nauphoetae]|uniref:Uncharacterized protein n=1 Tax=Blattamonas nauphoetae TaxID=2049346 RepID=A0ABQ9WYY1_9EUKA|nr:hypothetical protein BLNAU_20408 [Blattamonas nauphoetae]